MVAPQITRETSLESMLAPAILSEGQKITKTLPLSDSTLLSILCRSAIDYFSETYCPKKRPAQHPIPWSIFADIHQRSTKPKRNVHPIIASTFAHLLSTSHTEPNLNQMIDETLDPQLILQIPLLFQLQRFKTHYGLQEAIYQDTWRIPERAITGILAFAETLATPIQKDIIALGEISSRYVREELDELNKSAEQRYRETYRRIIQR